MNAATEDFVQLMQFDGERLAVLPGGPRRRRDHPRHHRRRARQPDVRARGRPLGVLDQALAAHNNGGVVIAQVKRLAEAQLPTQDVRVPGILVDAIVVAPDQMQTTQTVYDPALSGEIHRASTSSRRSSGARRRSSPGAPRRSCGRRRRQSRLRHLGPRAAHPARGGPARRRHLGHRAGRGRRRALRRFQFGCAQNPEALMPSPDQFTLLPGRRLRPGACSRSWRSTRRQCQRLRLCRPGRMSRPASVASSTSPPARPRSSSPATSPPARGHPDRGRPAQIVTEGKITKFVPEVEHVSFTGEMARKPARRSLRHRALRDRLTEDGLTVTEIAPGVDLERDVLGQGRRTAAGQPRPPADVRRFVPARTDGIDLVPHAVPDRTGDPKACTCIRPRGPSGQSAPHR